MQASFLLRVFVVVSLAALPGYVWASPDRAAIIESVRRAYRVGAAYECEVTEWSVVSKEDGRLLEKTRGLPGVVEREHPLAHAPMFDRRRLSVLADGAGRLRVDLVDDRAWNVARPAPRTLEVWGDQGWARPGARAPGVEVLLTPTASLTCRQRHDSYAKGETPFELVKSERSYLEIVRWVLQTMECAGDAVVLEPGAEGITMTAAEAGLSATIRAGEGTLVRVVFTGRSRMSWTWTWEGSVVGVSLPAPHPRFQYQVLGVPKPDGTTEFRHGSVVEFTRVRPVQAPAPSLFEWTTMGDRAWHRGLNAVIRPDGTIDEERTNVREQQGPPPAVHVSLENPPTALAHAGGSLASDRSVMWLWAAGLGGLGVCIGVVAWRRLRRA